MFASLLTQDAERAGFQGIGEQLALLLAEGGAFLILTARNAERLQAGTPALEHAAAVCALQAWLCLSAVVWNSCLQASLHWCSRERTNAASSAQRQLTKAFLTLQASPQEVKDKLDGPQAANARVAPLDVLSSADKLAAFVARLDTPVDVLMYCSGACTLLTVLTVLAS